MSNRLMPRLTMRLKTSCSSASMLLLYPGKFAHRDRRPHADLRFSPQSFTTCLVMIQCITANVMLVSQTTHPTGTDFPMPRYQIPWG